MIEGLRWFGWVYGLISLVTGLTLTGGAAFLLHQRWDIAVIIGLVGAIIVLLEGAWRQSCREKDALDPHWRTR